MKAGTRVLVSLSLCVVMATMIASLTTHAASKAATVVTDLSDYPPGTQVNVSGGGWLPGEVVQLTFAETSTTPPGGYTDGPFVFYATADLLGDIANGEFSTDQHDVGVKFLLTATGTISSRTAQTIFTDSVSGIFQIDGNVTGGLETYHDWDQVYADFTSRTSQQPSHLAGTGAIQFTTDPVSPDLDTAFANSPKDTQDITAWKWGMKAVSSPKTDLEHGFAAVYKDISNDHTLLYVGTDRFASGSNSAISIWFLQHPIGQCPTAGASYCTNLNSGTFVNKSTGSAETHEVGDLLIQASLGSTTSVDIYKWAGGSNPLQPITTLTAGTQYTQAINTVTIPVPWSFKDASGSV